MGDSKTFVHGLIWRLAIRESLLPVKVASIDKYDRQAVLGFLGITGYYRRFINYGKIAQPLTTLIKKEGFKWNEEVQQAFNCLKNCLSSFPVLTLPDFTKEFVVEYDASSHSIGAVLMQDHKPIAYFSKALSARTSSKFVYEKEIMALVLAVQHWRHYLMGQNFQVFTDHHSLRHLLQQRVTTADQQCWLSKLMGYQFKIIYKLGPGHKATDAFSRREPEVELHSISRNPYCVVFPKLQDEIQQDPQLVKLRNILQADPNAKSDCVEGGLDFL
ncbi:Retrovirus-related Pol polyprotein, partial [Mucuna pruriens]